MTQKGDGMVRFLPPGLLSPEFCVLCPCFLPFLPNVTSFFTFLGKMGIIGINSFDDLATEDGSNINLVKLVSSTMFRAGSELSRRNRKKMRVFRANDEFCQDNIPGKSKGSGNQNRA